LIVSERVLDRVTLSAQRVGSVLFKNQINSGSEYFDSVVRVWPVVFTQRLQTIIESFEILFGEAALPINFRSLNRTFSHLNEENVSQYQAAVLQCNEEINALQVLHKENVDELYRTGRRKLSELKASTER
jgi:hypothetical protein